MPRLIHYKVISNDTIRNTDHNIMVGGSGPLTTAGISILKRRMERETTPRIDTDDNIVICSIMEIAE